MGLFLTVHHHWESAYGCENSRKMFEDLMTKCDILFYEPPGSKKMYYTKPMEDEHPESPVEWYESRLLDVFCDDISIKAKMITAYSGESDRTDPLFCIDTSKI